MVKIQTEVPQEVDEVIAMTAIALHITKKQALLTLLGTTTEFLRGWSIEDIRKLQTVEVGQNGEKIFDIARICSND